MASISANGSKGHHKFTLEVSQGSQDITNNKTTVKYAFKLSPIQTSWNWEQWGSSISYTVTINGTSYTGTIPNYDGYATVTLKSGTQSVTHNADGAKSISYSFSVTDSTGQTYTSGNASASGTLALTTIPRATTPTLSASSVTMGQSITITANPASSSFKHKVRYVFGSKTGQYSGVLFNGKQMGRDDFTSQGNVTVTLVPPTTLGDQVKTKMSDTCTVYLYTYNASGTQIGAKSASFTLSVPSYTPTVKIESIAGNNLRDGEYVQGKSTVAVDISGGTSYGASIDSFTTEVDGKKYTNIPVVTSVLSSGNKTVKVTIKDSRGKTASVTSAQFTVREYAVPYITSVTATRQSNGTTVVVALKGGVSSINGKNAKTFKVTLNGVTNTLTSTTNTIDGTTTFTNVPTDKTLPVTATITDSYTTVTKSATLPTVAVTMDFYKDGKGIAMGKVAETSGLLDVAWKTKIGESLNVDNGAVIEKSFEVTSPTFGATTIKRNDSANAATIRFANTNGVLGSIGMTSTPNGGLRRWNADSSGGYFILDTDNLTDYIKDYVIEQTTSGDWYYTKWNNGKAEAWRKVTVGNAALTTSMVTGVWSNDTQKARDISLPSGLFVDAPYAFSNATSSGYTITQVSNTTKDTISYRLWAPYSATISNCIVFLYVLGRWK